MNCISCFTFNFLINVLVLLLIWTYQSNKMVLNLTTPASNFKEGILDLNAKRQFLACKIYTALKVISFIPLLKGFFIVSYVFDLSSAFLLIISMFFSSFNRMEIVFGKNNFTLKNFFKSFQHSVEECQVYLFSWVSLSVVSLTISVYSDTFCILVAVFTFSLFFSIFFYLEKKNILLLETTVFCCIFIRGVFFIHSDSNNFLLFIFFLVLFFKVKKTPVMDKIKKFQQKLVVSQEIIQTHYKTELYLFCILKKQTLWFTLLFFILQYVLVIDVCGAFYLFNPLIGSTFVVFKFLVQTSLTIVFLVDILVITVFNPGSGGAEAKIAVYALGVSSVGVGLAGYTAYNTAVDAALSTTVDPNSSSLTQSIQMSRQNFTSRSAHGNLVGKTFLNVMKTGPILYPGTNEIDVVSSLHFLKNHLPKEKQAAAASWMLDTPCVSHEEEKRNLTLKIKNSEDFAKRVKNPSTLDVSKFFSAPSDRKLSIKAALKLVEDPAKKK